MQADLELTKLGQEYKSFLFQKNISYSIGNFVSQKLGGEAELSLQCVFSRMPVGIPVRHYNIGNIKCIFDLDTWLDYFEGRVKNNEKDSFPCPGCKQYTAFNDYGIDFTLYNVLESKKVLERKRQLKLVKEKIIYSITSGKQIYYAILQSDKKTKQEIPGINPTVRVTSQNGQQNYNLSECQRNIQDQINLTLSKLQANKTTIILRAKKQNKDISQYLNSKKALLRDIFKKSLQLKEIGLKSVSSDFVFGFKKLMRDQKYVGSVLIVFYTHLGIWNEYEIKTTPEKHFQYDQVLFIKDQGLINENIIYVVGGRISNLQQSDIFVKITFPKNPFSNEKAVKIEYLPKLPQDGYNYSGSVYNNQVYIFGGQRKYEGAQSIIQEEILDKAYVFQQNQWKLLNQKVEKRFDGSFTVIYHKTLGKLVLLYGGTSRAPDGQIGYANQQQQHICQVFQLKTERFLGNGFKLKFSEKEGDKYQKFMLCTPIFSIPYGPSSELLIDGEFLKKNWKQDKQKYIFDWDTGEIKLSEFQSQSIIEPQLVTYMKRNWNSSIEFVTPVQDQEGSLLYGKYYTIHQTEVMKDQKTTINVVQLFEYNLANGTSTTSSYQTREFSLLQAQQTISKLINSVDKEL